MRQNKADDQEVVEAATPYIRSILAVVLKLRYGSMWEVRQCYQMADQFIAQLKQDIQ